MLLQVRKLALSASALTMEPIGVTSTPIRTQSVPVVVNKVIPSRQVGPRTNLMLLKRLAPSIDEMGMQLGKIGNLDLHLKRAHLKDMAESRL